MQRSLGTLIGAIHPGERDSHMKGAGMLVVSLTGVNFRFFSRLGPGVLGKTPLCLAVKVSFRVAFEDIYIKN